MPLPDDALICAFDFDADGRATALAPGDLDRPVPDGGWRWVHCDRLHPGTRAWVERLDLPELACETLFDEETRPRIETFAEGTLLFLRGVNLNPGAEPEDMVALRMWIRPGLVISLRRYKVFAVQAIRDQIVAGRPPASQSRFVADVVEGLTDRVAHTVEMLEDQVDVLEVRTLERDAGPLRKEITEVRRDVVGYRRFLAPQREAIAKLLGRSPAWLDAADVPDVHEAHEDLTRVIEMLDSVRDRSALLQEELSNRAAEEMNRAMYILSIVGAIFLPLGFLTGLLGINVGGIPWAGTPYGFTLVCLLLVAIVGGQLYVFRRMGWF